MSRIIDFRIMLLVLVIFTPPGYAAEKDPCSLFKNTVIEPSLISQMLTAGKDGHLYRVITDSSKMGFCVNSQMGMVSGRFQNFQGGIALKEPDNQTLISVDMSSIESDTLFIKDILQSEKFFDSEDFPELIFISSGFEWLNDTRGIIKGDMSIRGVTKHVAFYVEITEVEADLGDSDSILVKATTTIQRSEFGLQALSPLVSDKVNLCLSVKAEKYKAS